MPAELPTGLNGLVYSVDGAETLHQSEGPGTGQRPLLRSKVCCFRKDHFCWPWETSGGVKKGEILGLVSTGVPKAASEAQSL